MGASKIRKLFYLSKRNSIIISHLIKRLINAVHTACLADQKVSEERRYVVGIWEDRL